jgi:hypothetical protein
MHAEAEQLHHVGEVGPAQRLVERPPAEPGGAELFRHQSGDRHERHQ